jgi:hypothetical protein
MPSIFFFLRMIMMARNGQKKSRKSMKTFATSQNGIQSLKSQELTFLGVGNNFLWGVFQGRNLIFLHKSMT